MITDPFAVALARLRRRARFAIVAKSAGVGVITTALALEIGAAFDAGWTWATLPLAVALAVGIVTAIVRAPSRRDVARRVDRVARSYELCLTAATADPHLPMTAAVQARAAQTMAATESAAAYPVWSRHDLTRLAAVAALTQVVAAIGLWQAPGRRPLVGSTTMSDAVIGDSQGIGRHAASPSSSMPASSVIATPPAAPATTGTSARALRPGDGGTTATTADGRGAGRTQSASPDAAAIAQVPIRVRGVVARYFSALQTRTTR